MSNKNLRAQQKVIEEKLAEMLEWYTAETGGKVVPNIAVDKKTYRGKVLRWLEPIVPGVVNPCLVEEALGDSWTLRFEPFEGKIAGV